MVHPLPGRALLRDGAPVGSTTSSMWSYIEDRCLAMGYVHRPGPDGVVGDWLDTGRLEINVGGELVPVTPSIRSFCETKNLRVRLEDGP